MVVVCVECGSRDLESEWVDDDILGRDVIEYECNECGEVFDSYDVERATEFEDC